MFSRIVEGEKVLAPHGKTPLLRRAAQILLFAITAIGPLAAKAGDQQLATDEGHLRVFWRKWNELMETWA